VKKKKDWRSRPRKPAASKRTVKRGINLTPAEAAALKANAAAAGLTVVDYIVARCCQPGD
jgi:hypothetical protein